VHFHPYAVSDKLHPPRDGIPLPRRRRGRPGAQWSKLPSTVKRDIPWDILMAGKSSDTVRLAGVANLTFTPAEYLRSNPQGGNSLEERLSGRLLLTTSTRNSLSLSHVLHVYGVTRRVSTCSVREKKRKRTRKMQEAGREGWESEGAESRALQKSALPRLPKSLIRSWGRLRADDRSDCDSANPESCESSLFAFVVLSR